MISKNILRGAISISIWAWYGFFCSVFAQDKLYVPQYGDCANCYLEAKRLVDSMATGNDKLIIKLDERWRTLSDPEVYQILRLKPDGKKYSIERPYASNIDFRIPRALRGISQGFSLGNGLVFFSKYDSSYYATELSTKSVIEQISKSLNYRALVDLAKGTDTAYSSAKYAKMMREIKSYSHKLHFIKKLLSGQTNVTVEVNYLIRKDGKYSVVTKDLEILYDSLGSLLSFSLLGGPSEFFYHSQAFNPVCKGVYFSLADTFVVQMARPTGSALYKFHQTLKPYFPTVNGNLLGSPSDSNLKVIYIEDTPKQYDLKWLRLSKKGYKQVLAMASIGKYHQLFIEDKGRYTLYKLDLTQRKIIAQKLITTFRKPLSNVVYHKHAFHWVSEEGSILRVACL